MSLELMTIGCGSEGCLSEEVGCGRRNDGGVDMNDGWNKNMKGEERIEEKERE